MLHGELSLLLHAVACCATIIGAFCFAPTLSRITRLPLITIYLMAGLIGQMAFGAPVLRLLMPVHNAALGCITIAAGSELVVGSLMSNARNIGCLTISMSCFSCLLVGGASMLVRP